MERDVKVPLLITMDSLRFIWEGTGERMWLAMIGVQGNTQRGRGGLSSEKKPMS